MIGGACLLSHMFAALVGWGGAFDGRRGFHVWWCVIGIGCEGGLLVMAGAV